LGRNLPTSGWNRIGGGNPHFYRKKWGGVFKNGVVREGGFLKERGFIFPPTIFWFGPPAEERLN